MHKQKVKSNIIKKPAAATVFEDVVVLVEVTVYNPSRRCGLKESENAIDEIHRVNRSR
jgi:hypothetical protein